MINRHLHSGMTLAGMTVFLLNIAPLWSDITNSDYMKPVPTRPSKEAKIEVESMEILDDCDPDQICVEGFLFNTGQREAQRVRLRVEIGGSKQIKPRTQYYVQVEDSNMDAGERQPFDLKIKRKIPYTDKGIEKIIEVGKFNFKIVPDWNRPKKKPYKK